MAVQIDRTVATYHLNLATALIRQSKDEAAKPELGGLPGRESGAGR